MVKAQCWISNTRLPVEIHVIRPSEAKLGDERGGVGERLPYPPFVQSSNFPSEKTGAKHVPFEGNVLG